MLKNYSILFLSLWLINSRLNSQILSIGFYSGFDIVNEKYICELPNPMPFSPRLSYSLGLPINLKLFRFLEFQIEPSFIEKGTQNIDYQYDEKTNWKYGYFSNPIVFIIKPIKKGGLEFGTELSTLLYSKIRDFNGSLSNVNGAKTFEVSGLIGINYRFFKNTSAFMRYSKSFTPIFNDIVHGDPNGSWTFKIYNEYYSIGIRYNFIKIKI